jgi:hypothetical protein
MDQERKLGEQLCEIFSEYEVDTVVTVITAMLATAGIAVCSDKEVFLKYVNEVIGDAYENADYSDEPIQ